jgi:hypothetical protein
MATTLSGRLTKSLSKREADLQSMTSFDATITQPLQGSGRVGWAGSPQVSIGPGPVKGPPPASAGPHPLQLGSTATIPQQRADSSTVFQVDNDTYHRMLDEYRTAKSKQKDDELKIKQ